MGGFAVSRSCGAVTLPPNAAIQPQAVLAKLRTLRPTRQTFQPVRPSGVWENVVHHPSKASEGLSEVDYGTIIDSIANSV
jgi:hypothetical protein